MCSSRLQVTTLGPSEHIRHIVSRVWRVTGDAASRSQRCHTSFNYLRKQIPCLQHRLSLPPCACPFTQWGDGGVGLCMCAANSGVLMHTVGPTGYPAGRNPRENLIDRSQFRQWANLLWVKSASPFVGGGLPGALGGPQLCSVCCMPVPLARQ